MNMEPCTHEDFDSALRGVDLAGGPTDLFGPLPRDGRVTPTDSGCYAPSPPGTGPVRW